MSNSRSELLNRLTGLLLGLSVVTVALYALIFILDPLNPQSAQIVESPIDTPIPTASATPSDTPTPTNTKRSTNTPTHTPTFSPTASPTITNTLEGTPTPGPSPTPSPSSTPGPSLTPSWTLSPANYEADVELQSSTYGLNWAGIAGLVIGLDRKQQTNIIVRAWGDEPLGAEGIETVTGIAPQYGVSGFEFTLGAQPLNGTWSVQLVGDDGQELSQVITIEMTADPRANLAFIIFEQNH